MSPLTLRLLHGGQTSQARASVHQSPVAPAFDLLMIFVSLKGAWQGVPEVEICPIFLTILPRIGGEKLSV